MLTRKTQPNLLAFNLSYVSLEESLEPVCGKPMCIRIYFSLLQQTTRCTNLPYKSWKKPDDCRIFVKPAGIFNSYRRRESSLKVHIFFRATSESLVKMESRCSKSEEFFVVS